MVYSAKFCFFGQIFVDKKIIFGQFSDSQKFRVAIASFSLFSLSLLPDATKLGDVVLLYIQGEPIKMCLYFCAYPCQLLTDF